MQIPLQITARDISMTPTIEQRIRNKVNKLENFYARILGCRVLIESPHRSNHKGNLYNIRIRLTVPGGELVVKREPSENLHVALRDTFEAARRQLLAYSGKKRSSLKQEPRREEGVREDHAFDELDNNEDRLIV